MQIAGTPEPVTEATAVPMLLPHTPTMRIVERRQMPGVERRQKLAFEPAIDWAPGFAPSLSKRALIGICGITFASGILVATAIYRLRPGSVAARPAAVERIAPVAAPSVAEVQPLPQPVPEPVTLPAAPVPAAPEIAVAPATAKPAPAVRAHPAPAVRPKRPAQVTATRVAAPRSTEPDLFAAPPPKSKSKKWVDPFAE